MSTKSLKSISWDVSEEQYRADPAFSYSQIATFFRKGPMSLKKSEKEDTSALRGGSLVDTLLTAPEEFQEKFLKSSVATPGEMVLKVLNELFNTVTDKKLDLEHIPTDVKLKAMNKCGFYTYWKDITRLNKLQEDGYEYYRLMTLGFNKIIVSEEEVVSAEKCATAIKTNPTTSKYFISNPFDTSIENLYQLKFKTILRGFPVRCMLDAVQVNHQKKIIIPVDLKTTGKNEEIFEHSFIEWCYFIQAELYAAILKEIIQQDDYFKDFSIQPFRFVVVNKESLSPLEWVVTSHTYGALERAHYPSTWDLLAKMQWHYEHNIYNYTQESIDSSYSKPLLLKFLNNDE